MRKVLVFGNGLGRALSNDDYSLPAAIQRTCNDHELITLEHLNLMREFLRKEPAEGIEEVDLDDLHRAIFACDFLASSARGDEEILTQNGIALPGIFGRFVHNVATKLSLAEHSLPDEFANSLADFLRASKSHIATLNYDQLLYDALISRDIFRGYAGELIDGLTNAGYRHQNLKALGNNNFGLYLHLHGSPLVFERGEGIYKHAKADLHYETGDEAVGRHLVLTNVQHKTLVIEQSSLLASYWRWFAWTLRQPDITGLIFFGLSAQDEHLIRTIQNHLPPNKPIRVIEWSGEAGDREAHWREKFSKFERVDVEPHDDILTFGGWQD
ncbi:hypothetical protein [Oceanicaulis sp.]|uniref:hypothetical protein n=1 Tax=Oceanicaulis sp. TaxID=1924941 RepID=UPI003F71F45C